MRNLIITITLLFTASAMAMPKFLEGGKVTITLKNGKTYTYTSEEMALVKRNKLTTNLTLIESAEKIVKDVKEERLTPNKKNRIYILGGYGPTGDLKVSTDGQTYETKHRKGLMGGVGYQRKINNKFNVGGQIQTNGATSMSLGIDF